MKEQRKVEMWCNEFEDATASSKKSTKAAALVH